jgi:hypothetical protein
MTQLTPLPDEGKQIAKEVLEEAIADTPDTVIVLCYWKGSDSVSIRSSAIHNNVHILGALELAKLHAWERSRD